MIIQDLYIRNPEDPNFVFGIYSHDDKIESIVSKIKVILGTRPGQVFGDINFGIPIEDLVYETRINKFQLEKKIKEQIDRYVSESSEYSISPRVSFGKADGYDFCLIDFYINEEKQAGILVY